MVRDNINTLKIVSAEAAIFYRFWEASRQHVEIHPMLTMEPKRWSEIEGKITSIMSVVGMKARVEPDSIKVVVRKIGGWLNYFQSGV